MEVNDKSIEEENVRSTHKKNNTLPHSTQRISVKGDDTCISTTAKKRRQCRFPGCTNTIKSQGHCQKHGAQVKSCKVPNCKKQAQGQHDGMCKRHWREMNDPDAKADATAEREDNDTEIQIQNLGPSVYDSILPQSVSWKGNKPNNENVLGSSNNSQHVAEHEHESNPTSSIEDMPLIKFLRNGAALEPGWHRKHERLISSPNKPLKNLSEQLLPEEKQLILFETMLLSGTIYTNSHTHQVNVNKDFAHAWGRERGFHTLLVGQVCERRGNLSRKRRSDVGKVLSEEEKASFRSKLVRTKYDKKLQRMKELKSPTPLQQNNESDDKHSNLSVQEMNEYLEPFKL